MWLKVWKDLGENPFWNIWVYHVVHEILKGQLYALDTQVGYDSGERTQMLEVWTSGSED